MWFRPARRPGIPQRRGSSDSSLQAGSRTLVRLSTMVVDLAMAALSIVRSIRSGLGLFVGREWSKLSHAWPGTFSHGNCGWRQSFLNPYISPPTSPRAGRGGFRCMSGSSWPWCWRSRSGCGWGRTRNRLEGLPKPVVKVLIGLVVGLGLVPDLIIRALKALAAPLVVLAILSAIVTNDIRGRQGGSDDVRTTSSIPSSPWSSAWRSRT